jgi:hypothetical protein
VGSDRNVGERRHPADVVIDHALDLERIIETDPVRGRGELKKLFEGGKLFLKPQPEGHYRAESRIFPFPLLTLDLDVNRGPETAIGEQVARVKTEHVRYLDSELRVAGWGLKVRAFDSPDYVLLDGTMIRRDPDGISTVATSLDSGTLYLLADTFAGGFELYYIGR